MLRQSTSLISKELMTSFRDHPRLPKDVWYFVAGSTLSTLNKPEESARVLKFALDQASRKGQNDQDHEHLRIARRMREAMIKLTAIAGLPKTINSLLALKNVTSSPFLDEPLGHSPTLRSIQIHDIPSSRVLQQGQRFFDSIYGKISKRVMGQMDRSGTEDLGLTARLMYGYILSNTHVLSPVETSYVLIAGLIPQDVRKTVLLSGFNPCMPSFTAFLPFNPANQGQVNPQLKGHLKGALNNGATAEEVKAVRSLVLRICEICGMRRLQQADQGIFGWSTEVADL